MEGVELSPQILKVGGDQNNMALWNFVNLALESFIFSDIREQKPQKV